MGVKLTKYSTSTNHRNTKTRLILKLYLDQAMRYYFVFEIKIVCKNISYSTDITDEFNVCNFMQIKYAIIFVKIFTQPLVVRSFPRSSLLILIETVYLSIAKIGKIFEQERVYEAFVYDMRIASIIIKYGEVKSS